jgi:chromosome partitioning protein
MPLESRPRNRRMEFPMRTIAMINQKGGVGKTTSSVNLSAALSRLGYRVCLIDMDPQAHASLHLGVSVGDGGKSMYHVLTEEVPLAEVRVEVSPGLFVCPADLDLAAAEMELSGEVGREIILRDRLQEDTETFDYLIIDCPPSLGVLTLNALTSTKEVFLPLQPHFLALHGLSKLLKTIDIVARRLNRGLHLSGLIYCLCDASTRLATEVIRDVEEFFQSERGGSEVWSQVVSFQTKIRRNVRLAEAPSFGQSIFDYAASSHGAEDYMGLAHEVIAQAEANGLASPPSKQTPDLSAA